MLGKAMATTLRLKRVVGYEGRINDTVFQPATDLMTPQQVLVYFGGDVQDYPEAMQSHRDNKRFLKWNLENTARMLGQNFPAKHVIVVKPSRIEYRSLSCYDNFVPSNNTGVPEHTPTHYALRHLERLLEAVDERLRSMPESEFEAPLPKSLTEDVDIEDVNNAEVRRASQSGKSNGTGGNHAQSEAGQLDRRPTPEKRRWWSDLNIGQSRLTLIGFSKGCVVLNQLLYEFHYISTLSPHDVQATRFIERIEDMYWLDGGHAGGKNTWITSRSLLETLTRLKINIYIHVSPYQVLDESRPWIGREEKAFTALLRKLGAKVQRHMHGCKRSQLSLNTHFEVLGNFKRVQDEGTTASGDSDEDT